MARLGDLSSLSELGDNDAADEVGLVLVSDGGGVLGSIGVGRVNLGEVKGIGDEAVCDVKKKEKKKGGMKRKQRMLVGCSESNEREAETSMKRKNETISNE